MTQFSFHSKIGLAIFVPIQGTQVRVGNNEHENREHKMRVEANNDGLINIKTGLQNN